MQTKTMYVNVYSDSEASIFNNLSDCMQDVVDYGYESDGKGSIEKTLKVEYTEQKEINLSAEVIEWIAQEEAENEEMQNHERIESANLHGVYMC